MANTNKKTCALDNDCDKNFVCAFDENDMTHYCINNEPTELYYGCLDKEKLKDIELTESNSNSEMKKCIDFSRKQMNKDGLEYNYMIFKPKKNIYIDTTTINIYLKCDKQILAIIPYNDYFTLTCDDLQENCILNSKDSLLNFIIQNSKNCNDKLYLEIIYQCENEGIIKKEKRFIDIDNYDNIKVNLSCPIDKDNDKFKSKCIAIYNNNNFFDNNDIDKKRNMYECKNPIYKVPMIVNNINNYKKLKDNKSINKIKTYDNEINEKIEDLKKLKAEKYIALKKIQNNSDVTIEEAYEIINKNYDKIQDTQNQYWKLFKNYDAAQYLFNDNINNEIVKLYGNVYTIEEAMNIASENNESFFVWYHNSYELDNFSSKLYFIDIYNIGEDIIDKNNWAISENVTTGILKLETYQDINYVQDEFFINESEILKNAFENNELLHKQYMSLIENQFNLSDFNVNQNVITNLDNKNTTLSQAINMTNYELKINDIILKVLYVISFFMFILFLLVLIYYNNLTAGKIKIFSMPTNKT